MFEKYMNAKGGIYRQEGRGGGLINNLEAQSL